MTQLGMGIAFEQERGDFSRMGHVHPNIYLQKVRHKTIMRVDEKGTEAAAATIVEAGAGSGPPLETFEMRVDRSFFFAIVDRQTSAILFLGSVFEPGE